MELTIAVAISILSAVMTVANFVVNRKDKAVNDAKENNFALINYRLDELDKNVQKILDKLDSYDKEVEQKISEAMTHHLKEYHKGE